MKKGLLILLLVTSVNTFSSPTQCPLVSKIQNAGLSNNLVQDQNGLWYAGRTHEHYGTPYKWTFVIGEIKAPDRVKALLEGYEALSTLSYKSGPTKAPSGKWLCLYNNDEGFASGAITPPIDRLND